jgi:hypothetical protein
MIESQANERITLKSTDIEGVPAVQITEHWPYNAAPRFVTLTLEELKTLSELISIYLVPLTKFGIPIR